jgi:multiple sugar transport system substrate-binding protein
MTRPSIASSVLAIAMGVAACVVSPAARANETLKFISFQKDEKGVGDWYNAVIKEFEAAHAGVKIEFTKVEQPVYADTMTTLFAGGSPPDIVHLAAFDFPKIAENGWLEDLDPYIKSSGLDLKGWAGEDKCKWKGHTYCIVALYFGFFLAYNDELMAKAGAKVPTNYAEWLDVLQKTTHGPNGERIAGQFGTGHETGAGTGWYLTEMLNYMLDVGAFWTNKQGEVTLNTPQMIEALARWKAVNRSGVMPADPKPGDTRLLLIEGKLALKVDGPWLMPIIAQAKPEIRQHIKLTAAPFHPPVGGTSNVWSIAKDIPDAHKKLVWDFLMIATSDKYQTLYGTLGQSIPSSPRADTAKARELTPDFDVLVAAQREASAAGVDRIPPGLEWQYNEFGKMIQEEAQKMIINDLDPKAVAEVMQKRAVEIQKAN